MIGQRSHIAPNSNNEELIAEIVDHLVTKVELIAATQRAQGAEAALRDLNHEVCNSLGIVDAKADDLDDLADEFKSAEKKERIRQASLSTKKVVQDLVRFASLSMEHERLNLGEMPFAHLPLHLNPYFEAMKNEHILLAKQKYKKTLNIDVKIDQPNLWVMSDNTALNRIFPNFMTNALKFTPDNGSISILVETSPETKEQECAMRITVKDTGSGMPPEKANSLFQNNNTYNQVHDQQKMNVGGNGLGLKLAAGIIQKYLKGTVTAESKVDEGTSIIVNASFALPTQEQIQEALAKAAAQTPPGSSTPSRSGSNTPSQMRPNSPIPLPLTPFKHAGLSSRATQGNLRILVAEDNEINQRLIEKIILAAGHTCTFAANGQEAIDKYKNAILPFHLIFMDIQMPVKDGYAASQEILAFNPNCPIFALSGNTSSMDIEKAQAVGMKGCLPKPFQKKLIDPVLTQYASLANQQAAEQKQILRPSSASKKPAPSSFFLFKHNKIHPEPITPTPEPISQSSQPPNPSLNAIVNISTISPLLSTTVELVQTGITSSLHVSSSVNELPVVTGTKLTETPLDMPTGVLSNNPAALMTVQTGVEEKKQEKAGCCFSFKKIFSRR